MKTKYSSNQCGYIYLDILVGLLIFGIGMMACVQINNDFIRQKVENENYLRAVQICVSSMDELIAKYKENPGSFSIYFHGEVKDEIEQRYERIITIEKDGDNYLLRINVKVQWKERDELRDYAVETEIADDDRFV